MRIYIRPVFWMLLALALMLLPIALVIRMYLYTLVLSVSDTIQALMAYFTLLAVLAALLVQKFWDWVNEPIINVEFNKNSERCLRWAVVPKCNIQDEGLKTDVKRYYFNLKITNFGGLAKKLRVRADIINNKGEEAERFEPTTLRWINRKEEVDLMRGEPEYVNLVSQVVNHQEVNNRLRVEVFDTSPRGIAWDRPLNTYKYSVAIFGENIKPIVKYLKFIPNKSWKDPGELSFSDRI